jgi:hypothetical protein
MMESNGAKPVKREPNPIGITRCLCQFQALGQAAFGVVVVAGTNRQDAGAPQRSSTRCWREIAA